MSEQHKHSQSPRKYAGVHPELMADFVPLRVFKPKYDADPDCYDDLTDKSPFSFYSWAFLRRNRFYQNSFDMTKPQYANIELWGYRPSTNSPAIHGLMITKGYWENGPTAKAPLKWEGIHSFYDSFSDFRRRPKRPEERIEIPNVQIPFVFDIDSLLGPNCSAIDIQLQIARAIMLDRAQKLGIDVHQRNPEPIEGVIELKQRLRMLLRIADLLSPQRQDLDPSSDPGGERQIVWETGRKAPSQGEIASRLPQVGKRQNTAKSMEISKAVTEAYELMYEWRFLELLSYDHWDTHFFPTKTNAATESP